MSDELVAYTVKETLDRLDNKLDKLDDKIDEVVLGFAKLPTVYVTQAVMTAAVNDSKIAKRFAITAALMSLGALGTYIGLLI